MSSSRNPGCAVDVTKITRMLERASERDRPPATAGRVVAGPGRFARDPGEFVADGR